VIGGAISNAKEKFFDYRDFLMLSSSEWGHCSSYGTGGNSIDEWPITETDSGTGREQRGMN